MGKQTIFISCGQFTEAEKRLGKEIAVLVKRLTGLEPFFAEEVQDLNGLDSNILSALRDCVAFITVLHPRGAITRPDNSKHVRASVWIEQEIAVATYIQRVEKRQLPIIAFKHVSVGREGIRDLLQLNPIEFTDEAEVLAALPARLEEWKTLRTPPSIEIKLQSVKHVRASVWIEQEIAVATYIQRVEKRQLPIIAFKHVSVGREGIRDLLQLNPIEFTDEAEVLAALPARLEEWKTLRTPPSIEIKLQSVKSHVQDDHVIRKVQIILVNDTSERIAAYDCEIRIPASLLKHWDSNYPSEVKKGDPAWRYFRFNERGNGILQPRDARVLTFFDYCTKCAHDASSQTPGQVASSTINAKIWINGREYSDSKTIQELAEDAERRHAY